MVAAHPTPMIAPRSSGHLDEGSRGAQTAAGEQIERQPWEVIGSAQSEKVNGGLPRVAHPGVPLPGGNGAIEACPLILLRSIQALRSFAWVRHHTLPTFPGTRSGAPPPAPPRNRTTGK